MLKLLDLLARGNVARAAEDLYDRNALLILDQQIRETRAALERSRRALALAIAGPWAMGWHLTWQIRRFDPADGPGLLRLFRSNRDAGALPALALALAALA